MLLARSGCSFFKLPKWMNLFTNVILFPFWKWDDGWWHTALRWIDWAVQVPSNPKELASGLCSKTLRTSFPVTVLWDGVGRGIEGKGEVPCSECCSVCACACACVWRGWENCEYVNVKTRVKSCQRRCYILTPPETEVQSGLTVCEVRSQR